MTLPLTAPGPGEAVALLEQQLVAILADRVADAGPGHCLRVDDVNRERGHRLSAQLRTQLQSRRVDADIYVLTSEPGPDDSAGIGPDRAVELRNRKRRPLLLLVPDGEGAAASSLDNSFERLPLVALVRRAGEVLERRLQGTEVGPALLHLRRLVGRRRFSEPWSELLAALVMDASERRLGKELWRVGLVPDLGDGIRTRLERNVASVAAISRPRRSTASLADRLVAAGVPDGAVRLRLRVFFEREAGVLTDSRAWTQRLGQHHAEELTFEVWPSVAEVAEHIESLGIVAFRDDKGKIDSACKLQPGGDGQLVCPVAAELPGTVVLKWATEPARTDAVAH